MDEQQVSTLCPKAKRCGGATWCWIILVLVGLVALAIALAIRRVANQLVRGQVGNDPETTCHWWRAIDWTDWMPQDLKSADRSTFVFAANMLKYTYQEACRQVEGTFPNVEVVIPPPSVEIKESIYGVDRGNREFFGWAAIYKKQFLVLTIRGSMVEQNWLTDFSYRQVEWLDGHKVHGGYLRLAETMFPQFAAIAAKYPELPIFIAGHSLGAGVTGLVSYYLWHITGRGKRYIKSVVFGCPRTGSPSFAEALSRNVVCFNVQNLADVTVDVPLAVMPNLSGPPFVFQHWDEVRSFTLDMKSVPDNHHIETYLFAVENLPPFADPVRC